MTQPDISVVILCWNNVDLVEQCLDHLRGQRGVSLECILVDNGSQPSCFPRLTVALNGLSGTAVRSEANLGFAAGTNLGLYRSRGKYILSLNADVQIENPVLLQEMICRLDREPTIGLANPRMLWPDGSEQPLPLKLPSFRHDAWEEVLWHSGLGFFLGFRQGRRTEIGRIYTKSADTEWARGACLLIRKELMNDVGFLDGRFFFGHEEQDFSIRARSCGWTLRYFGDLSVIHAASATQSRFGPELILHTTESKYWYWRKHGARWQELTLRLIVATRSLFRILIDPRCWRSGHRHQVQTKLLMQALGRAVKINPAPELEMREQRIEFQI